MAMNTAAGGYPLPCGRDLDRLWDHLEDGAHDDHERACGHCHTARQSLLALRAATRELAADTTAPSQDLTSRIMHAVRTEIRHWSMVGLSTTEPGMAEVSTQAVAAVLRFAADGVAGVRARRCRIHMVGVDEYGAAVIEVELSVAVSYHSQAERLEAVRERVSAAVQTRVGLRLKRLDLIVDDLYDA
ncbi:MAG: Asp23/Gls24 family envelope stress response protein [Haloechinothrix sp.]